MIHYALRCGGGHEFDGWFRSSASFDRQAADGMLECPVCAGTDVGRALMAPRIVARSTMQPAEPPPPGHALPGHALPGHAPPGHKSPSHTPPGQTPSGHDPSGHDPAGRNGPGQPPPGPADRLPARQVADPAPPPSRQDAALAALPDGVRAALQRIRAEIEKTCDYVGPHFAHEVRRMAQGQDKHRPVYGEATPDEAAALAEDGIEVARIPWVPRADS